MYYSTQSVKIALIFHNGFFEVRFLVMEHVFTSFLDSSQCGP